MHSFELNSDSVLLQAAVLSISQITLLPAPYEKWQKWSSFSQNATDSNSIRICESQADVNVGVGYE